MRIDRPLLVGLVVAYLLVAGHPLAWLFGVPLSLAAIVILILVAGWVTATRGRAPGAAWFAVGLVALLSAKFASGAFAPAYGLSAEYRTGSTAAGVERSTDWPGLAATRIDGALAFRGADFPVHFFNDAHRFNYFTAAAPRRDALPFDVGWRGYFWARTPGEYRFELEANGRASLAVGESVGGSTEIESGLRVRTTNATVELSPGLHPIAIRFARPAEEMPWLVVSVVEPGGAAAVLGPPLTVRAAIEPSRLEFDWALVGLARVIDLAFVTLLVGLVVLHMARGRRACSTAPADRLERPLLGLYTVAALLAELWSHRPLLGQTILLSGGNDWLAYEGFARQVVLDGPLLTEGKALGQGAAFYYQPLYIYWLALAHWVGGEGLFAPLYGNAVLGVLTALLVYALARELFGRAAAAAALLVFTVLRATVFAPTAGLLLSENLLFPLVPLFLLLLARAATGGRLVPVVMAGVALGLGGLTRTTPLALMPIAALVLAVANRRLGLTRSAAATRVAAFGAACLLTLSPATARNYLVSGKPVLITTSTSANLWETHRPSAQVDLSRIDRDSLYEALDLDRYTREVLEYIRQDPLGYAASMAAMGLFAVGVVGAPDGVLEVHVGLLGMTFAYVATTLALPRARALPTWFLHGYVLSHLALMSLFLSNQYGFRLILPMYVAMTPIVGLGLAAAGAAVARGTARRLTAVATGPTPARASPTATAMLLLGAAGSLALVAALPLEDAGRESFYTLSGDAAIAARVASRPESLGSVDAVYFVGDDSRSSSIAYLRGLAYPSLRWFDGARGLVLPPTGERALYVLPERAAPEFALRCLGDAVGGREIDGVSGTGYVTAIATRNESECAGAQHAVAVAFRGLASIVGFDVPAAIQPGQRLDTLIRWEPLDRPSSRARPVARLLDSRGRPWAQGESAVYPSASWRPNELVLGVAGLDLDQTLPPGEYRLDLGFIAGPGLAALSEDGPWGRRGQTRARLGTVRLVSRSAPLDPASLPITHPVDASFEDARLLGVSLERDTARPGERVRLSLFWQSGGANLPDREARIELWEPSGRVIQSWAGRPVDGTYPTSSWKPREIVRDTWDLLVPATIAPGTVDLAAGLVAPDKADLRVARIASLAVQPLTRRLEPPNARSPQEARFGNLARLVGFDLRDRRIKPGESLDLTLHWQAIADGPEGLAVSVQLVGAGGQVVLQQEAEPAAGRRPTAGWLAGEYVEDGRRIRVGRDVPRGRYGLLVGLVPAEDGDGSRAPPIAERVALNVEVVVE